jgi:leader peptidase (prepilin peptidase)/N-methyltransferase
MGVITILAAQPALLAVAAGLLGLIIGSFLNVVIYRLPIMLEREWRTQCAELLGQIPPQTPPVNLWLPRSYCPNCQHPIRAFENIPLLSYFLQGGRCTHCKAPISLQYPLVEATSGVLTALSAWHFGWSWQAPAALLLTWGLLTLSVIDLQRQLLPDSITLPLLWLGLGLALFGVFTDLRASVIGAMSGYLSLWSVYWVFRLFTGREGMGQGDFKLLAMLGAWQGWQYLPAMVIISAGVGSVLGSALILLRRRERSAPLPFGPFLAAAGWITLLWGEPLNQAYLHWIEL